jgi:hypothetical protein
MLILVAFSLLPLVFTEVHAKSADSAKLELTPAEKEVLRQRQVSRASFKAGISREELIQKLYEPVYDENLKQYKQNARLAQRFGAKATEENNKKAKLYSQLAKLFASYSEENKTIVNAIRKARGKELKDSFKKVVEIEDEIFKLTGKRVERTWFTSDELKEARKTLSDKLKAEAASKKK